MNISITERAVADSKLKVWEQRWKDDQLRWHKNKINSYLEKYVETLLSESDCADTRLDPQNETNTDNGKPRKFFVPLCGKTLDISYLLSLGHSVFAVEAVKQAIETLEEENLFGLVFDPKESLYSTENGQLKIFLGDLFTCPIEKWGPFNCIWDRGSLTAIDVSFRSTFINVMQRSVQDMSGKYTKFSYLLQAFNYDKFKSNGRGPKCVNKEDMETLYGEWTNFRLLESAALPEGHVLRKMISQNGGGGRDDDPVPSETVYILKTKSS